MESGIKNLRNWITGLIKGSISDRHLSEFVQFSRVIIEIYLKQSWHTLSGLHKAYGFDIKDMALDCLGEVFGRDEQGNFYKLEKFRLSLNDQIESLPDYEIFFAYKSFLIRMASAQLDHLYGENDPAGKKIYRNIRENLKNSDLFYIKIDFRGSVLYPIAADPLDHLPAFPSDELESLFTFNLNGQHTTPTLLRILHSVLLSQQRYRRSI